MDKKINFEIAKLLDGKNYPFEFATVDGIERVPLNIPTIAEVVMWLYEKHNIWIYADSHEFGKWCYKYKFNRPYKELPKITERGEFSIEDYSSPTEAYEAAITYALEKKI